MKINLALKKPGRARKIMKKKYSSVIRGKDAREQRYYESGLFIMTRPETEYDDGWWLVPFTGYPEWFSSLVEMANHIYEFERPSQ